ncbi:hypothetical protein Tco_0852612, partial [Tanacetum coccineum]
MFCEPDTYRRDLLENLDTLEAVIHRVVITYGKLQLQSQDVQINPVQAVDDSLIVSKSSWIESENNNALSTSVNETQLQQHESLVTESTTLEVNLNTDVKALDAGLVITESSRTKSDKHDTSSNLRTYITHDVDADIRPVNDQVPFAEVQLTAQHNVLANEQQHTEQSEPIYDTYLLEKVDSNTTPDSTNMCHRGGEIDQDAEHDQVKSPLLKAEFLKTNDMVEKEVYNELSNRFLQLEKHCISLEISIQQKEESFQSNKPCKNQDSPEFREFFEINELKAQLQAKNSTINNLKEQIKNVHEKSNEAKVKHDIDVLVTINIEMESSVAKLLTENKKLNKENEHLKQTYKELYDSIKKTRIQTKDHNDSLIAQVNSKTVENADLKAQIQEKVFANAALKNELRKLKGTCVDTKFAKPSILGKPFASQVDVINDLSKPVTPYYVPKVRESVFVKPHHVIASGSSRNSSNESYGSNDMAHKYYLEFLKKVNSRAKVQSPKTRNINKPVEPKSHTQKPGRQIAIGQRFSLNKSSAVREKLNTPRSCLRWIPTGRIFKTASLRWIPTGKMFTDSTTKVDSEPPNGSNEDITNPYECKQSLDVSASTLNLSAGLVPNLVPATPYVAPTNKELEILFQPMFDEYMEPSRVERPVSPAPAVSVPVNSAGTPSSTTIDQDAPSPSHSPSHSALQSPSLHQSVTAEPSLI